MKKVIIDLLGADGGITPLLRGAVDTLRAYPELHLVLAGPKDIIDEALQNENQTYSDSSNVNHLSSRVEVLDTSDYIRNDEPATCIFNGRDESSIALSLDRLKSDEDCIGYLSAGNTGAILIGATFRLGLTPGLKTPALSTSLRCNNGQRVCLVDCGANVNCTAKDMAQFALLGNAFARSMYGLKQPRIALLSVGREAGKGNPLTVEAYKLIEQLPVNFIGNAEGYDVINGYADVIVADGYAGNLMLKCIEASGQTAMQIIRNQIQADTAEHQSVYETLLAGLSPIFDLNSKGGATFLGTKKPIIKMHGCAVAETVLSCVEQLLTLHAANFDQYIADARYTAPES
jgi:glycerol-3-phosphate acyltransferase PlsX